MAQRRSLENMRTFSERRKRLAEIMPKGSVLILSSAPESVRNDDVDHPYRQDSNFYYLTGFEEPGAYFIFTPGQSNETHLFCRPKDPERETWTGFRFGPELAQKNFSMDRTYDVSRFQESAIGLMEASSTLFFRRFKNPQADNQIDNLLQSIRAKQSRSGFGMLGLLDSDELIGQLRVFKSDLDLLNHRRACTISCESHIELMRQTKPGVNERELHGLFIYEIMKRGAAREGYGTIVAGGDGACTLHYVFNDQQLKNGDLLLVDAGAEYNYFTGDITRTYPVSGKFSKEQAEIYSGILAVQKSLIEMVRPGIPFQEFHKAGARMLSQVMLDLGLLTGRLDDIVETAQYKKYYPHGIGHYLGMDVHDEGLYKSRDGQPREIEAGMVFTIEPGIYIPSDDTNVPAAYRGIGIRIEDNILVTQSGFENLTAECPKEISELEAIIGKSGR